MTLRHLRIFSEVCKKESITKAAETLNMAQPSVSNSIRELESFYGVKLFERMNRRLYLTSAGETLLHYAHSILSQCDEAKDILQDVSSASRIRIGSNISYGTSFLPSVLADFISIHPELPVYTLIDNSKRIEEALLHNELDFAIVDNLVSSAYFQQKKIMSEEMIAVCSPDFPFLHNFLNHTANRPSLIKNPFPVISLKDFDTIPLLLRESGSGSREFIQIEFHKKGIKPLIAMESISPQALVNFCLKGLGVLILPSSFLMPYIEDRRLVSLTISDASFHRNYYLIYHNSKYLTKGMKYFLQYLTDQQSP